MTFDEPQRLLPVENVWNWRHELGRDKSNQKEANSTEDAVHCGNLCASSLQFRLCISYWKLFWLNWELREEAGKKLSRLIRTRGFRCDREFLSSFNSRLYRNRRNAFVIIVNAGVLFNCCPVEIWWTRSSTNGDRQRDPHRKRSLSTARTKNRPRRPRIQQLWHAITT